MDKHPLIAIVGMDGIFPGAPNLDRFWQNIVDGIDQSVPVPEGRWIVPSQDRLSTTRVPDRPYSSHACLITDFTFDPDAFALDPDLTRELDPVHQLTLAAGKRAVQNCVTAPVDHHRIDTILAAIALPTDSASSFSRKILGKAIEHRLFPHASTAPTTPTRCEALASRVDGLPAALLAAEMGFGGDSFTLDAACASSIYAVKLACHALAANRADMVVTGGVSRPECLYTQTGFSQLQALSVSGRCAPFDRQADGLVVGEGVGILVLKRLADAIEHDDTIHGVIHGVGLSNDMRGNLLAPESRGQVRAMRQAYRSAGWQPSDVDHIECHGTGTRAGDATEIQSLIQLWKTESSEAGTCAIGSVKSMIGHLLTAAGAAGMIKTLLAIKHLTLPPSINFEQPPENSPLRGSPFKVQTKAMPWHARAAKTPRRAAVSAFGFGGINAHILFEEWPTPSSADRSIGVQRRSTHEYPDESPAPVAIVGMDVTLGSLNNLHAFAKAVFHGHTAIVDRPPGRWKGADAALIGALGGLDPKGAYVDSLDVAIGEFQIPPNEIDDILPQQLLALKVGAGALTDAGFILREPRERMGVVFGLGFDFEATNFHLRWQLFTAVKHWNAVHGLNLDDGTMNQWMERLRDQCAPPLTPPRVMGALGGIVASRMAREFRFGGPSFVVSADAASGIKALQVAVDLLQGKAVDAMLIGAVDLAAEGRNVIRMNQFLPLSPTNAIRSFDATADGTLPGDGAVALVLKPLAQARIDGDRIYAVIRGIGSAGGDDLAEGRVSESTYCRSLTECFGRTGVSVASVSYVEAHGAGTPDLDRMEIAALTGFFPGPDRTDPSAAIALGSTKPIAGFSGAADGLASLAKTALCLHHRVLPPLAGFRRSEPSNGLAERTSPFHVPDRAQPWYRDRERGPRAACCASITMDGNCSHVLMQEDETSASAVEYSGPTPAIDTRAGLFVVSGNAPPQLIEGLARLEDFLSRNPAPSSVETAAGRWMQLHPPRSDHRLAVALILKPGDSYRRLFIDARQAVASGESDAHSRQVFFRSRPIGADARVALVYPGSGNHYLGMGRDLALRFPGIVNGMDRETEHLKTQFRPWNLMPWRRSWQPGWEAEAISRLKADPLNMIFGQVVFGDLMTRVLDRFSVRADAVIGYSLGESSALFAQGVWPDRGDMLARMQTTDLFTTQLAGPCLALRQAWRIPMEEAVVWRVAVVNRPAKSVRETLANIPRVRLLIVNSPHECVIGGLEGAVDQAIASLDCQAVYLDGVVTVHCDAASPVAEAYRRLHVFPTTAKQGLDVYSCSWATTYEVTSNRAADSIVKQAVDGFDFTQTIKRACADGVKVFIEVGPRATCSRMIDQSLTGQPHVAVAANYGNEDEIASLLRCLARLVAERVPVNLKALYEGFEPTIESGSLVARKIVSVAVGGHMLCPRLPEPLTKQKPFDSLPPEPEKSEVPPEVSVGYQPVEGLPPPAENGSTSDAPWAQLLEAAQRNMETTASAHRQFLDFSQELTRNVAEAVDLQTRLLGLDARLTDEPPDQPEAAAAAMQVPKSPSPPAYDREMCMAFAVGSVGRVLGPAFDVVDTHRVRVRLPDEPLMLVDRIVSVQGEMLSMESGRVVTEHDVLPGAWYLDGDRAPVCISVEAGQADLFLSSYLGIDHQVKGERAYRLLDAVVVFHRGLPRPGETIRYEIAIDRFVRQGETWMFFFRFEGYINGEHLISMHDGCAGFFTEAEVVNSGGIILTQQERQAVPGRCPANWQPPVPMARETYSDDQVEALRQGDLAGCFGRQFTGIGLSTELHLPGGRMRLIHRIVELDPEGGRYGLGLIRAETDIHPDDWFLVCHFVDDMVMPGTLMYECCGHTLRVFLQRMGWVTDKPGVCYEPVIGNAARLKCRGPVTPVTRHVHYEIQISEIGYGPEPYAIADAHMSADGRPIVFFKNMSMKMTGIGREEIEAGWCQQKIRTAMVDEPTASAAPLYDRASILAFATGKPSEAFGDPYRIFDEHRKIARLPGPPYCFMDRVVDVEPPPWMLKADGWVTAQYDIPEQAWYFAADRSGVMPFCVLLEIALQPCGWLAAYAGSALRSQRDLKFRNLGGSGVLHRQVTPATGTMTMRCRMTKVSEAADMIIENFEFEVHAGGEPVYAGDTYFGFFSAEALNEQKGMGHADPLVKAMLPYAGSTDGACDLSMDPPHTPESATNVPVSVDQLTLPGKALMMIDRIEASLPEGGASGLGYIRGLKQVDPGEWFFKAHFHQDPVCPGSLGLESFLQLIKTVAIKRWPDLKATHRFRMVEGSRHNWTYRGQIIPKNKVVAVEALITHVCEGPSPAIRANGLLKVDGLPIYTMENFELALVPAADNT